jgi:hypothetical protein
MAFKNGDVLGTVVGAHIAPLAVGLQISCLEVTYNASSFRSLSQNMHPLVESSVSLLICIGFLLKYVQQYVGHDDV